MPLAASAPTVAKGAWVAPSASLIGDVDVSDGASVWYGTVIRGEWKTDEKRGGGGVETSDQISENDNGGRGGEGGE